MECFSTAAYTVPCLQSGCMSAAVFLSAGTQSNFMDLLGGVLD